ncbi:MAG: DUF2252 family protein [Calditrichia bacterium]
MSQKILSLLSLVIMTLLLSLAAFAQNADSTVNALFVDPASRDFSSNEAVLERLLSGPHGYFRFINVQFSQEICRRIGDKLAEMPMLNLHGDAHLEQYAITDLGRGLTDFDDSSTGPGGIDLLRVGVSLHLVARENGWSEHTDDALRLFIAGYTKALENPATEAPEPSLVKRIRDGFKTDREGYFKWIASVMQPVDKQIRDSLEHALMSYIDTKRAEEPELRKEYFDVVESGALQMGIGSALDMKFLIRIAGKTDDPLDDIVLECKEVRDLSGIECINSGRESDPFRILLGQTRIAYSPFEHLGYFRFNQKMFWVHSWVDNYKELKVAESFVNVEELKEVLYDVGVQLGKGHVKHIASPLDLQLRRAQQKLLKEHYDELTALCAELAVETVEAWEMFTAAIAEQNVETN